MQLIDAHAHLDSSKYDTDRDEVIARARAAGIDRMIAVGQWHAPGDFGGAADLAARHAGLFFATVGIHPHEVAKVPAEDWQKLEEIAARPETVAVGETGLDYHYDYSPRDEQRQWFRFQIDLAGRVGKPLVVHTREADDDTVEILREAAPEQGVIHCFTGGPDRARAYLDLGLYLSVAGVLTFKNADDLREAVRITPLDRLLIETDCPYLAPIPYRGKRNEPAYVRHVAEAVAAVKGVPVEEVARATTENAKRFFRLP